MNLGQMDIAMCKEAFTFVTPVKICDPCVKDAKQQTQFYLVGQLFVKMIEKMPP